MHLPRLISEESITKKQSVAGQFLCYFFGDCISRSLDQSSLYHPSVLRADCFSTWFPSRRLMPCAPPPSEISFALAPATEATLFFALNTTAPLTVQCSSHGLALFHPYIIRVAVFWTDPDRAQPPSSFKIVPDAVTRVQSLHRSFQMQTYWYLTTKVSRLSNHRASYVRLQHNHL